MISLYKASDNMMLSGVASTDASGILGVVGSTNANKKALYNSSGC